MRVLLLCIFSLLAACSNQGNQINTNLNDDFTQKVIYGDDNRLDLYQVQDQTLRSLADSTLGLINTSSLVDRGNFFSVLERSSNLCPSEPFSEQLTGPWCSGFLVGPDLVVTAGHCISSRRCSSVSFMFGYSKPGSSTDETSIVEKSEVYKCREVIAKEQRFNGADWAVVRLDREVTNHSPLRLRRDGITTVDTNLTVIGHPFGLPTKIAGASKVKEVLDNFFKADLDTYGGNSGSAVFNTITGEVEGIAVRGATDFIEVNGCNISIACDADEGCPINETNMLKFEEVTRISEVLDYVPEINVPPLPPTLPPVPEPLPNSGEYVSNRIVTIPDNSLSKAVSTITGVPALLSTDDLKIGLSITHTYIGDLKIYLISPNEERIVLHDRTGWSSDNIIGIYGDDLNSFESISKLGNQPSGDWRLEVRDLAPFDTGSIDSWAIIIN